MPIVVIADSIALLFLVKYMLNKVFLLAKAVNLCFYDAFMMLISF
jgi:hypothetical protein